MHPKLKTRLRLISGLVSLMIATGCVSPRYYNVNDCTLKPIYYGQCFAKNGYDSREFQNIVKFCQKNGVSLDMQSSETSRLKTISELCSTREGVFTSKFRSESKSFPGRPYHDTCESENLIAPDLKKADGNAKVAAIDYRASIENQNKIESARKSRAEPGNLWNALVAEKRPGPEDYAARAKFHRDAFEDQLSKYPEVSESGLLSRAICVPSLEWTQSFMRAR